jgi:hypothetical protein
VPPERFFHIETIPRSAFFRKRSLRSRSNRSNRSSRSGGSRFNVRFKGRTAIVERFKASPRLVAGEEGLCYIPNMGHAPGWFKVQSSRADTALYAAISNDQKIIDDVQEFRVAV